MEDRHELRDERLQETARRLGARAAQGLDVERAAQGVLERLRREPASRRALWRRPAWLRAAAAIVLLLGAALVVREWHEREGHGAGHFVVEDLQDLSADQLEELLASLERTFEFDEGQVPPSGLEGLGEDELRAVLRSLEG